MKTLSITEKVTFFEGAYEFSVAIFNKVLTNSQKQQLTSESYGRNKI